MNEQIEKDLFELADKKYKEFHSGLCPGVNNIIGVRVPILREYAKKIAKEYETEYLINAKSDYYEEIMLQGMVIGLLKLPFIEIESYIKNFVPKIDNWAICDVFCAGLKITKKHKKEMWDILQMYLKSDKEFELRFAIVMLLDFYIDEEYIDKALKILSEINSEYYYVKMAVAWAISIAFIKFTSKTLEWLKEVEVDDFTYNKSIQKIIESFRVDEQMKEQVRKMRK